MFETTGIFPHPTRRQTQTQTQAVTDSHRQSQKVTDSHRKSQKVTHKEPPLPSGTPRHRAGIPAPAPRCTTRPPRPGTGIPAQQESFPSRHLCGSSRRGSRSGLREAPPATRRTASAVRASGPAARACRARTLPCRGAACLGCALSPRDSMRLRLPTRRRSPAAGPAAMVSSSSVIAPAGMHLGAHLKMSARQRVC